MVRNNAEEVHNNCGSPATSVTESCLNTPVAGHNFAVLSQEAGKAAYSREYGFVHASAMRRIGGWGALCTQ